MWILISCSNLFPRKLQSILAQYVGQQSKNQGRKGFFLANNSSKILEGIGENLKSAIHEFLVGFYIILLPNDLSDHSSRLRCLRIYEQAFRHTS